MDKKRVEAFSDGVLAIKRAELPDSLPSPLTFGPGV
jgi:hypothetical protein